MFPSSPQLPSTDAIATEKLAAINEAYAQIAKDRVSGFAEQFDAAWQRHTGAD